MKKIVLLLCITLLLLNICVFADGAGGYVLIGDKSTEILFTGSATEHYLILSSNGVVSSLGKNEYGQCGETPCEIVENINYIDFDTDSKIIDVKAGKDFSLALDESGTVWGWGNNENYQLGISRSTDTTGTPMSFAVPQKVSSDISAIAVGDSFSACLSKDGTVYISGKNQIRQKVFGDEKIKSIYAKSGKLLALNDDNILLIWDYDASTIINDISLVGKNIIDFAAGAEHVVYVLNEGNNARVYVCGNNTHYQLGIEDSNAIYSEPICVLTIPDVEDKTVSLKVGEYSTFIDVFSELSSGEQIDEYCFGTGCYYISEDCDDYSVYSEGFEDEVVKTPALRSVSHQIIAVGDGKSIAYRFDDAIEMFGNNEKPTVIPIVEPNFSAEPMYEYQYENIDYQAYNVNFVKINKDNFEKYSKNYDCWEYIDEHSFNVKIKDFISGFGFSNWNPKFGVIRLYTDITDENRIVGTIGQKLWNFSDYGVQFRTEEQEITHGNEDGKIIHVSAQVSLPRSSSRPFNIPVDVNTFYEKPGVITENTKLGLYLYDLPYGTEGIIENISGNTFDIRLKGNSTADLDYDLPIKLCYIYVDGEIQNETIGEYNLNETKVNAAYITINNVIIKPTQNTPEKLTVSANLTRGRENGESISVSIDGGTFAPELTPENWQIIGTDGISVEKINRIDDNNADLVLKGHSTDKYTSLDIRIMCEAEEYSDSREYDEGTGNYYDVPLISENNITIKKQTRSSGSHGNSSEGAAIAKPSVSIDSGEVTAGTQIELLTTVSGAKIYYTTDGSTPTVNSTIYAMPITVTDDVVIKYIAVSGTKQSQVQTASYTVKTPSVKLKDNSADIKYIDILRNEVFDPDKIMTRYEILTALDKLFDIEGADIKNDFTDVDTEYEDVVDLFTGAKLIEGYPDNTFRGSEGITRAEFVKLLCDMLKPAKDDTTYFTDVSGHWAESYINSFYKLKLIEGYPDGTFKPDGFITKAEGITILNRVAGIKKYESNVLLEYLRDHWAYGGIIAAAKIE